MTLSELLAAVGDDNLLFQVLNECLVGNQTVSKKGMTRLTFGTNEDLMAVVECKRRGLVVWVDEDKFQAAAARLKVKVQP